MKNLLASLFALQMILGCASLKDRSQIANNHLVCKPNSEASETNRNTTDHARISTFARHIETITGQAPYAGNKVKLITDHDTAYELMFEAINSAKHYILLETFILADDKIGKRLAELLIDRKKSGVAIYLIYDGLGSIGLSDEYTNRLNDSGIRLLKFHPPSPYEDIRFWRINNRDHRKILIVDGAVAFTGGINIQRKKTTSSISSSQNKSSEELPWDDAQIRIEGPVITAYEGLFRRLWNENSEHEITEEQRLPYREKKPGNVQVQMVASDGGDQDHEIYDTYLYAFALARERIWITQSYFSPDRQFLDSLTKSAMCGVDVRIIVPATTDSRTLFYASRSLYRDLLEAGIKIFEREDAVLHAKTAVIDGIWTTVGSSNLDIRSFLHNDEANAVILGREIGEQMEMAFKDDLAKSRRILLEEWNERPVSQKIKEQFMRLFNYWL